MISSTIILGVLLAAAPAPNCPPPIDESLQRALREQDLSLVQDCLRAGASPETRTERGKSVLMAAASGGDVELMERLIKGGASVDERNDFGGTPLMYAAARGRLEAARHLVADGADPNLTSTTGWSALTVAAAKNQADLVKLLLRAGADPNATDIRGWTPLMHAAANGYPQAVEALLVAPTLRMDVSDAEGITALHCAVAGGSEVAVRLLLDRGADRNARTRDGETPADLARRLGRPSLAAVLSDYKSKRSQHGGGSLPATRVTDAAHSEASRY